VVRQRLHALLCRALLTAAAIGDRLGRLRVFIGGITLFTIASAASALATEPWMLTAARAVQGAAGAAIMPLSLTLLAAAVPERMRNAAVGIWGGSAASASRPDRWSAGPWWTGWTGTGSSG